MDLEVLDLDLCLEMDLSGEPEAVFLEDLSCFEDAIFPGDVRLCRSLRGTRGRERVVSVCFGSVDVARAFR